ncbi:MAG: sigma-54 dependent transcriptional regulator [Gammaproteobacteria bacterium]
MARSTVLIIDDEPDICELLSITLKRMDLKTDTCGDLSSARSLLESNAYDLCLTDMKLPDGNGLDLVDWMQKHVPSIPVAVITAHGNVESAVKALKLGAFDFVSKPLDLKDLRSIVSTALRLKGSDGYGEQETELLGSSEAMRNVRNMIARVARSQAPVHICGESGTGKELVARLIHSSGPRSDNSFVPVNCGAIPDELMESELFGHKRGSFTGAVADKPGLMLTAEGGTLFLDEIADLPLHMQVKLLRVIQEKAVRPVGATMEVPVDVRILSASHRNLGELVQEGEFREDLYYRVNVIELLVPPLRDRGRDVLELADLILGKTAARMGVECPRLSRNAQQALKKYSFPGNVRELENILERAITMRTEGEIDAKDIELRAVSPTETAGSAASGALGDHLVEVERDAIVKALEQTRYNKTAAAKLLGISFRALRYRIKKLGLE